MSPRTAAHRDLNALTTLRGVQDEIVSRRQLVDLGFTHHVVRRQVAAGRWQLFGSKVVATTHEVLTRRQTCRAAVLHAGFRAHLGGSTSLEWAGLENWYDPLIHLLVPAGTHVSPMPGVAVHRSHRMSSQDLVVVDGLRVTSPARAALDGARWMRSTNSAAGLIHAVIQQGLATVEEIDRCLGRFAKVSQKVAIAGALVAAEAGAESRSESVAAELVVAAGFPEPVRQLEIMTPLGTRRVDLAVPLGGGRFLVVEVDGPHHEEESVRLVDAVKDATLLSAGHVIVRFLAEDVLHRQAAVLTRLRELRAELLPASYGVVPQT